MKGSNNLKVTWLCPRKNLKNEKKNDITECLSPAMKNSWSLASKMIIKLLGTSDKEKVLKQLEKKILCTEEQLRKAADSAAVTILA